jgi:hypothetical protein
MISLVLKSFWLIEAGLHRGRVHFITTNLCGKWRLNIFTRQEAPACLMRGSASTT